MPNGSTGNSLRKVVAITITVVVRHRGPRKSLGVVNMVKDGVERRRSKRDLIVLRMEDRMLMAGQI